MSITLRDSKHRDTVAGEPPGGGPRAPYGPSSADRER